MAQARRLESQLQQRLRPLPPQQPLRARGGGMRARTGRGRWDEGGYLCLIDVHAQLFHVARQTLLSPRKHIATRPKHPPRSCQACAWGS